MNLGYKHLIDNDGSALSLLQADGSAATAKANVSHIHVKGLGKVPVANLLVPSIARAVAPSVFTNVITVAAGTIAGISNVTLKVEAFSSRYAADYSRMHQDAGKIQAYSVKVAAGATATVVATAIQAEINARIAKYNDLPYTVGRSGAVLTLTGVAGKEDVTVKLAYDAVTTTAVDTGLTQTGAVTATEVVTEASEGLNSGAWVEENIAMNTGEATRLGAPGTPVIRSANYASIYFGVSFVSDMIAEPSVVGQVSQAGSVQWGIFLNETAAPVADGEAYAILVDILQGVTGFTGTEEDGGAITGTALVAAQDFWGYGAGDVD